MKNIISKYICNERSNDLEIILEVLSVLIQASGDLEMAARHLGAETERVEALFNGQMLVLGQFIGLEENGVPLSNADLAFMARLVVCGAHLESTMLGEILAGANGIMQNN